MFKPIEGGSFEEIFGLNCQIPPEGYIYDYETCKKDPVTGWLDLTSGKLRKVEVHKRSSKFADCFWERDPRFNLYKDWKKDEDRVRRTNPNYVHEELEKFISECWLYRFGGFWFYNNRTPTYISGSYWFHLSCVNVLKGAADYRNEDRRLHYHWNYCLNDPHCYGQVVITKRRYGKTTYAGSLALEMSTRTKMFNVGIQSMNKEESKNVYGKAIISPYKKMPYFFHADYSNIGQSTEVLRFSSKNIEDAEDELESMISYKPSGETAYDGWRLSFYYGDEVGKTEGVDVVQRWGVVRPTLEDHNGRIIGKALHTSTVEDMSGTAENFLDMWKGSDPLKRSEETGQTPSGMYKFFINSVKTIDIDKYGFSDEEKAMRTIMARRKQVSDKPRLLSELIRKTPLTEEEAFQIDSKDCPYNPIKLNDQLTFLNFCDYNLYEVGNLEWTGERYKSEVKFVPNSNGRFMIREHPMEGLANRHTEYSGGRWMPANKTIYFGGCDPYDHSFIEIDGKKGLSNGAISIIKKAGTLHTSENDGAVVLFYCCRVSNPDVLYDDAMKAAVYYGAELLIEVNKPVCAKQFEKKGLGAYSAKLKGSKEKGINTDQTTNKELSELTDVYIEDNVHLIMYKKIIEEWLRFDVNKTTKFDAAMAVGFALMLIDDRGLRSQASEEPFEIKSLFGL